MKFTLIALFISFTQVLFGQNTIKHQPLSTEEKLEYFLTVTNSLREAANNPGMAISIVYQHEIILMSGMGFRNLEEKLPVTPQTSFQLGSLAKAMTGFIAAQLVDDQLIDWNDPAIKHLPEFEMIDDYHTKHVTVKDLMTHHTGLAQHYYMMYGPQFERNEILKLLPHMGLNSSLREKYLYNNFTFTIAGILEERVTGQRWENLVQNRIFQPLEMNDSYNQYFDIPSKNEITLSYSRDGKTVIPEKHNVTAGDTYGPSGGLYSTIEDITKWTQLLIDKGINGKDTLISTKQFNYITDPLVVRYPQSNRFYGIGWDVTTDKKYHTISHNGVTSGQKARILFIPELGFGITVLCNQYSDLPSALTKYAEDIFVYDNKPETGDAYDWLVNQSKDQKNKVPTPAYTLTDKKVLNRINDYCGNYTHPAYGQIEISKMGKKQLKFKYYDFIGILEQKDASNYVAHTDHSTGKDKFPITYRLENNRITGIEILFPAAPKMFFEKE